MVWCSAVWCGVLWCGVVRYRALRVNVQSNTPVHTRDGPAETMVHNAALNIKAGDKTLLSRPQYCDCGPAGPGTSPTKPDAWQGSSWCTSVTLLVGCLTSQQHASCLRDESAQTILRAATLRQKLQNKLCLAQLQYTDIGPTSPSADPTTPGSHWSTYFCVTGTSRLGKKKNSRRKQESNPESVALEADALTTGPTRRSGITGTKESREEGVRAICPTAALESHASPPGHRDGQSGHKVTRTL